MSRLKKIVMAVLALALVSVFMLGFGNESVKADEGNNTWQTAKEFTSKSPATGVLNNGDEIDWFKYTVEKDCAFVIDFKITASDLGDFNVKVYNDKITNINNGTIDQYGYSYAPKIYAKGTELYFSVQTVSWNSSAVGKSYEITITYLTDFEWEKEDNGTYDKASSLSSTKPLYGVINSGEIEDVDWYSYKVKNSDAFHFELMNMDVTGAEWNVKIYDQDRKELVNENSNSGDFSLILPDCYGEKNDICYISVGTVSWNSTAKGKKYQIKVVDNSASDSKDSDKTGSVKKLVAPISILDGTNVVVGYAQPGAKVYVTYGSKTYSANADDEGLYKVVTAKLTKGKTAKIYQKVGSKKSKKLSVKVTES